MTPNTSSEYPPTTIQIVSLVGVVHGTDGGYGALGFTAGATAGLAGYVCAAAWGAGGLFGVLLAVGCAASGLISGAWGGDGAASALVSGFGVFLGSGGETHAGEFALRHCAGW